MIERAICEAAFRDAVSACDPAACVQAALGEPEVADRIAGLPIVGVAIGKAAFAMARGIGPVEQGLVVAPAPGGKLPAGWRAVQGSHPGVSPRSLAVGAHVHALMQTAADHVAVVAISGGASALMELPAPPVGLADFVNVVDRVARAGASIHELNVVRGSLSSIKGGLLALASSSPVITLATSDVVDDDLATIGSGPTIGPWLASPGRPVDIGAWRTERDQRAAEILARYAIEPPARVAGRLGMPRPTELVIRDDLARLVAPMSAFGIAVATRLRLRRIEAPLVGDVNDVAARLVAEPGAFVAWGEPTLALPAERGEGGRAQQLALLFARELRGTERSALVTGSDGIDGPAPHGRPAPAGAYVDGATWSAIARAGVDPSRALERCDAGPALAAAGALVITGPTGINHGDVVVVG